MGEGGERFERLRFESGAQIDIGGPYGPNERLVYLSGTPQQLNTLQIILRRQ